MLSLLVHPRSVSVEVSTRDTETTDGSAAARLDPIDGGSRKRTWSDATVSALCYSLIEERCNQSEQADFLHNRVVRFVLERCDGMPDFLWLPLKCLILVFDLEPIVQTGRPFHRLDHARRWHFVQRWRRSRIGARRELIRFFESLVIFGWYSANHGR